MATFTYATTALASAPTAKTKAITAFNYQEGPAKLHVVPWQSPEQRTISQGERAEQAKHVPQSPLFEEALLPIRRSDFLHALHQRSQSKHSTP